MLLAERQWRDAFAFTPVTYRFCILSSARGIAIRAYPTKVSKDHTRIKNQIFWIRSG